MPIKTILKLCVYLCINCIISAEYAPSGCDLQGGGSGKATCDFGSWSPPLDETDFGPGDVYQIIVENVDGTIPSQAFSGIDSDKSAATDSGIKFECSLENIILSPEVFTPNLNWIKFLTFKDCYVQDGIASGMLSNLTSLEEFQVDGGIVGPLASDVFSGLNNLVKITINADFLDTDIPSGLFTNLISLEEIDLKSAGISSIAADTFTNLDLLTKLDLSENSLTTLPEGLFTSLVSLSTVELGTNTWDCTCDLSWLSTWALYTGVSIDVTCTTPSDYSGLTLSRVVASLGCINSATSTTTVTVSSDASSSEDSTETLTYIALGVAGLAGLLSLVTSMALCCVCKRLASINSGHYGRLNDQKRSTEQTTRNRQTSVSTIGERPPSYTSNTSQRMFINSPIQTTRESKVHPFYDVTYKRPRVTSDA